MASAVDTIVAASDFWVLERGLGNEMWLGPDPNRITTRCSKPPRDKIIFFTWFLSPSNSQIIK